VQDNFWYWNSYEMVRRLMLTSVVVVVRIVAPDCATLYIVMMTFVSFAFQAKYTPFKDDDDDLLSLMFLSNEFFLALMMFCEENWSGGHWPSIVPGLLLVCNICGIILYAIRLMFGKALLNYLAAIPRRLRNAADVRNHSNNRVVCL
jgi:hypothetical protein